MMEEAKTPAQESAQQAQVAEPEALLQRLQVMEDLLRESRDANKKVARHRGIMSALMLCLVVVFAVGLFMLNTTMSRATRELPQLIEATTESVQQMEVALEGVSKIDFDSLNVTIGEMGEGLAAVDFEALNDSIHNLERASKALSAVLSIFG